MGVKLSTQILQAALSIAKRIQNRSRGPAGSVNISTIIWIVIGVMVAGGVSLWLTAGGGISAITNLLKSVTTFFNGTASTL
jgi:hypothetical protein